MKKLSILALAILVGCTHPPTREIRTTRLLTCPPDYMYNSRDGYCHYTRPPSPIDAIVKPKARKRLKRARIDCEQVLRDINKCSV